MNRPIIEVEGLSKRYRLGAIGATSLRESAERAWGRLRGRASAADGQEFWALHDVSFSVQPGEVVGIIGRNGAGKSTLLKILSRITDPTSGRAVLRGRVASLLEVGTGFHPDLTGRENIFLNGAILGMMRPEIRRKFDEIVAFAEIERFVDTPVKRYSSGMYVRLAFAVAAHLEPEILIVDEVLAVGDAQFQQRCLGKMEQVSREGRTVLVVSHNMASVINLCTRGIVLTEGRVSFAGDTRTAVEKYLSSSGQGSGEILWSAPDNAPGNERVRLRSVRIWQDGPSFAQPDIDITKPVTIEIQYLNLAAGERYYTAIWLADRVGTIVLASSSHASVSSTPDRWYGQPHPPGVYRSLCVIPGNFLNEGLYTVTAIVGRGLADTQVKCEWVVSFTVHDTGAMRQEYYGGWIGVVRPRLAWQTEKVSAPAS